MGSGRKRRWEGEVKRSGGYQLGAKGAKVIERENESCRNDRQEIRVKSAHLQELVAKEMRW